MIVYEKNFGHQTYAGSKPITDKSIYDLASITKIASTLMAFMKLVDEGKVSVDDKLGKALTSAQIHKQGEHILPSIAGASGKAQGLDSVLSENAYGWCT